jgi:hypothetical protein
VATLRNEFAKHVGASTAIQSALADYLGEHQWNADLHSGIIDFGNNRTFPIQFLGSESSINNTWLWGWANEQLDASPHVLKACAKARAFGMEQNIPELINGQFPVISQLPSMVCVVVFGIMGKCAYYRGKYDTGAAYLLLQGLPEQFFEPLHTTRVVTIISKVISMFDVDHTSMAVHFLSSQGFAIELMHDRLIALRDSGEKVEITFDPQERISNIEITTAR